MTIHAALAPIYTIQKRRDEEAHHSLKEYVEQIHRHVQEMEAVAPYFLDLIRYRHLSNQIAESFGVAHQSPQVLLIDRGKCVYHDSHFNIDYQSIKSEMINT